MIKHLFKDKKICYLTSLVFMLKTVNTSKFADIFYMLLLKGGRHDAKN